MTLDKNVELIIVLNINHIKTKNSGTEFTPFRNSAIKIYGFHVDTTTHG